MRNPSSSASSSSAGKGKITPCCSKVDIKKGPWTPEEDEILSDYIRREGEGRWRTLPKRAGLLRCGKSCRLRWMNYLRPSVKRGCIAPDEEDLILRLHRLLGNRWSLIAGRIPGRTDNEIKNYWNTRLRKRLISQGIDPRTHRPLIFNQVLHDQSLASSTSNPNPPPSEIMQEAGVSSTHHHAATNSATNYNIPIDDGFLMGGSLLPSSHGHGHNRIEDDTHNRDEDTFSSFLDSLINDSDFMNIIDEQQPQPGISGFSNMGAIDWESADVLSTKVGSDDQHGACCSQLEYSNFE